MNPEPLEPGPSPDLPFWQAMLSPFAVSIYAGLLAGALLGWWLS